MLTRGIIEALIGLALVELAVFRNAVRFILGSHRCNNKTGSSGHQNV